ncbi:MAG TPA: hypothetical protein VE866_10465 [Candidatus Binatia bacterium]|nr:hypothetical protein [Candidatus Binatia bacterium]
MSKPQFSINEVGGLKYVAVKCPVGHRNRGQLVSQQTMTTGLTCAEPSCNMTWTASVPFINGLEVDREAC